MRADEPVSVRRSDLAGPPPDPRYEWDDEGRLVWRVPHPVPVPDRRPPDRVAIVAICSLTVLSVVLVAAATFLLLQLLRVPATS